MADDNKAKHTHGMAAIVAAVTAGVIAVGGLTWWQLAGDATAAHEHTTQTITRTEQAPDGASTPSKAQEERIESSRAALEQSLDEARAVYRESVGKANAFEARKMLGSYIEGTEGLLEDDPQLAENFESRAQELKDAMDDVRAGMAGKRTKAKTEEEARTQELEEHVAMMNELQQQAEQLARQQNAEAIG